MTNNIRGYLFLAGGAIFPILFLFAGGVVKSGNGEQLTIVFMLSYLLGVLIVGPFIISSSHKKPAREHKPSLAARVTGFIFAIIVVLLSNMFFHSRAFATTMGQSAFIIFMGITLSLLIPLGLFHLRVKTTRPDTLQ